jgi:hypothetical protein
MKKYKVRGIGTEFLQEVEIEADSKDAAEQEFQDMWENGELYAMNYELKINVEGGK